MLSAALTRGIDPARFWSLSLTEWLWLTRTGPQPLNRARLDALMVQFPDTGDTE